MKPQFKLFLENMQGNWISQQTLYYLDTKQKNINTFKIHLTKLNNNIRILEPDNYNCYSYICKYNKHLHKHVTYNYIIYNNSLLTTGKIQKIEKNSIIDYLFTLTSNDNLKIRYKKKNIYYIEYIYSVNKNFRISIVIIKKSNQYLSICFTSIIKIIKI